MKANIKKNKNGYYQKKIPLPKTSPDGRRLYKYIYSKSVKALEEKASKYVESVRNNIDPEKNYTFAEVSEIWLDKQIDISPNTKKQYSVMLSKYINPLIGRFEVKKLTLSDFDQVMASLYENGHKGDSFLKKIRFICNGVMKCAYDYRIIVNNPFANGKLPRDRIEGQREKVSDLQEQALLRHWNKHKMGIGALIMLGCGLRRGELLALKWGNIDFGEVDSYIHVRESVRFEGNRAVEKDGGKTKSAIRDVPIPVWLVNVLKSVPRESLSYVIHSQEKIDAPMTQTAFRRAWNGLMTTLNLESGGSFKTRWKEAVVVIPPFTPHQLRHTYQSRLYRYGVDVKSSQQYLGHADISTTLEIYTHLDKDDITENMRKFLDSEKIIEGQKVVSIN